MVFQNPELWPHLSVQDHIRFVLHGLLKAEQKKRVDALLAMTDLVSLKERYPGEISGGQVLRHHRSAQGRYGGTGTVPSFIRTSILNFISMEKEFYRAIFLLKQ